MGIIINKPGILTTIQDSGRYGYQKYGVPISGCMDMYSMNLANLLVGNDRNAEVFEITFAGAEFEFQKTVLIAICGGNLDPTLNGERIDMNRAILVKKNDRLSFNSTKIGCRTYLAISARIEVPIVMDSKSTYIQGNIGGFKGRRLIEGDYIPISDIHIPRKIKSRVLPENILYAHTGVRELRVLPGSHCSWFSLEGLSNFLTKTYKISLQNDRMGYRLEGAFIEHLPGETGDILSEGIGAGSVQVAGDGLPIIMCADHQTTGGYTKIASIISVDMHLVSQLKTGDEIRFKQAHIRDAQQLLLNRKITLDKLEDMFSRIESRIFGEKRSVHDLRDILNVASFK